VVFPISTVLEEEEPEVRLGLMVPLAQLEIPRRVDRVVVVVDPAARVLSMVVLEVTELRQAEVEEEEEQRRRGVQLFRDRVAMAVTASSSS
jgi:predicted transcriptional regulator